MSEPTKLPPGPWKVIDDCEKPIVVLAGDGSIVLVAGTPDSWLAMPPAVLRAILALPALVEAAWAAETLWRTGVIEARWPGYQELAGQTFEALGGILDRIDGEGRADGRTDEPPVFQEEDSP